MTIARDVDATTGCVRKATDELHATQDLYQSKQGASHLQRA